MHFELVDKVKIKARWGLALVAMLVVLAVFGAASSAHQWSRSVQSTVKTHLVIEKIQSVLYALLELESAQRGFLVSRDKSFLVPYESGRTHAIEALIELKALIADNPGQAENTKRLNDLANIRLSTANDVMTEAARLPELRQVISKDKQITDQIKEQARKMIAEENRLLAQRNADVNIFQMAVYISIGLIIAIGIGISAWVIEIVKAFVRSEQYRAVELSREIEVRKQVEDTLNKTMVKLSNSNNDLQQFAYVASHDLQEPLRAVIGFLTLLNKRLGATLEGETKEWLDHAVEGGTRMRTLVNDLLAYSRLETQGKPMVESVDMNEVVELATSHLKDRINETGAEVDCEKLPVVKGDGAQLAQLVENLLSNAMKYRSMSTRPRIEIRSSVDSGNWIFSFKDNGIGFNMEHAKRIFVIFQRLHSRASFPGTGIGLALCKRIVERHGGQIWCESQEGKGSTFFFSLPIRTVQEV